MTHFGTSAKSNIGIDESKKFIIETVYKIKKAEKEKEELMAAKNAPP